MQWYTVALNKCLISGSVHSGNGFPPGRSTQEAVLNTFFTHMYSCINQHNVMGVVILDAAKAFHCIDYELLYKKLKDIGMSLRVIQWFRTYLSTY